MKRIFATLGTLAALLVLGAGCATSKPKMKPAPEATSVAPSKASPPAATSEPKEIVTPPVAMPPAGGQSSSGSQ